MWICSRKNLQGQEAARINEVKKKKNLQYLKHPEMSTGEEEIYARLEDLDDRETLNNRRERTLVEQDIIQPQIEEPWLVLMQKADKW